MQTMEARAREMIESGDAMSALLLTELLCENVGDGGGVRPDALLLRARALHEVREFDSCLRVLRPLLATNSPNIDALRLAMKAAFELGDLRGAMMYSEALLHAKPGDITALCYAAKCAELSEDVGRAVELYQEALMSDSLCNEAFNALMERHLWDKRQLRAFIDTLSFTPGTETVREVYKLRCDATTNAAIDNTVRTTTTNALCVPQRYLQLHEAQRAYTANALNHALQLCDTLLQQNAYDRTVTCLHLSILVDLRATPRLFERAHVLAASRAHAELALYAIGCYYYSLANYERAGRYFSRATELDRYFAEAWIAYGHCYTKLEEGEQALSVYRRTLANFPALHACCTFVGMQYSRVHQWPVAMSFLQDALRMAPNDALTLNEIGVLYMRTQRPKEALRFFRDAFVALPNPENPSEYRDCILFNLGTVLRKLGEYAEAVKYYTMYIRCRPNACHGHCALAFTHHLGGNLEQAIAHYHTALSLKSDAFCRDMLERAMASEYGQQVARHVYELHDTSDRTVLPPSVASPEHGSVSFTAASHELRSRSRGDADAEAFTVPSPWHGVGRALDF